MSKTLSLLLAALGTTIAATAQTIQWSVRPDGINTAPTIFRLGGKVGLRAPYGKQVLPAAYDSITPFQGGYALAIQNVGRRGLIKAIVREGDYDVTELAEELFATRYSYFSEGKMCVSDASRQQGFVSPDGNLVIPCQYKTVHPFFEGLASVTYQTGKDKENVYYINKDMNEISVEPGYGEVIFGSSFVDGEAVVYTVNRKGYCINRNGRKTGSYKQSIEEAYRQARQSNEYALSGRNKTTPDKVQPTELPPDPGYVVFQQNGLYGYKTTEGSIVAPAQFRKAEPFRGGYASVMLGEREGTLQLIKDGSFNGKMEKNRLKAGADGTTEEATYCLDVPEALKDANIVLRVVDDDGRELGVTPLNNSGTKRQYAFALEVEKGQKTAAFDLYVGTSDKLFLWSDHASLDIEQVKVVKPAPPKPKPNDDKPDIAAAPAKPHFKAKSPYSPRKKADQNDNFPVSIQITNDGNANGMVTVTLMVNGKQEGKQRVNVKAGSTSQATISFKVKKDRLASVVEALLDSGTGSKATIDLRAFY